MTGLARKEEKLSENRATSATFRERRRKAVKRPSNFCHVREKEEKLSEQRGCFGLKGFEMLSITHYVKMASFLKKIKGWECENCIN